MAKKKKVQESTGGVLVAAAKSIGAAAGTVAAAVGVTAPKSAPKPAPKPKVPKLEKKNKTRLPRRHKKAAAKLASKSA